MSSLYAFLVGINQYDGEIRNLQGCEYDSRSVRKFLRHFASVNELDFKAHMLLDDEATRSGVIKGFTHFRPAKPGDICVFYFSGHGSEVEAPPELQHLQADGKLQTLVCHNSRTTAQDLTDKEVSHLIWEATTEDGLDKGVHFLAIFDSCHSGSVSRNTSLTPRLTPGNNSIIVLKSMYGHNQFTRSGQQVSPRVGRHIALSASRSYELAYEKRYKGIPRGVFTTTLLETLEQETLHGVTYDQLMMLIHTRLHPEVQYIQHPVVEVGGAWAQPSEVPLFGRRKNKGLSYYMWFDQQTRKWLVNAGKMEGLAVGQELTVFQGDKKRQVAIRQADDIGQVEVVTEHWANPQEIYPVVLQLEAEKLVVAWGSGINHEIEAILTSINDDVFVPVNQASAAYIIDQKNQQLLIYSVGSARPLFEGIDLSPDHLKDGCSLFVAKLEQVGRWIYLWKKGNPDSALRVLDEFDISLQAYPDFINEQNPGAPVNIPVVGEIPVLSYANKGGKWEKPVISLSIQRKSDALIYQGSLWVTILFFNEKYGVTAQHFPVQEFRADDQMPIGIFYVSRGRKRFFIPLYIPDEIIHDWGEATIKNQFKIIISSQPFSAGNWELPDLSVAKPYDRDISRGLGGEEEEEWKGDWAAYGIPFFINHPKHG